ncbi:MAG TPA: M28 family metallopeptidase [Candidatus Acidoferrales bacterium]|nr:M28 family metallopeptidase [Candidatus Acidoferrales bacterium]
MTQNDTKISARAVAVSAAVFAISAVVLATSPLRGQSKSDLSLAPISGERMLSDIRALSSDEFQGRGPGTKGEELTIAYVEKQFREAGLEPGNPDGRYLQSVPLAGITPNSNMELTFAGHDTTKHLAFQKDYVAWTKRTVASVSLDADMIFVGYGVQAPEYAWDDFKGVDVKGKVLVVLINDPPVKKGGELDPSVFGGKAMTYYGRWTYKFEKATELGAAGCIIVHETERAGYPWTVVRGSWSGEQFTLLPVKNSAQPVPVEAWITHEAAQSLFRTAGYDFETLKEKAASRNFHPVPLGMRAQIEIHNQVRQIQSHNVIAKLPGSDPALKNEYVIYSAHWDHFGIGPEVNGQTIYHGALDNASGSAALLELGRAFASLKTRPKRSILFLSVTAEEQGLLGSAYYAEHPLYPLARTVADINMDGMNVLGKTRDITEIGMGQSTLDEVVASVAGEQDRVVRGDPEPEKGFYYRSDHFSFAEAGVPAFDPDGGIDYVGKPAGWGMKMRDQYTAEDYHKPSDVIKPYWDMSGDVEDCQLYLAVGYRVANSSTIPQWQPKSEFKAVRERSLAGGR